MSQARKRQGCCSHPDLCVQRSSCWSWQRRSASPGRKANLLRGSLTRGNGRPQCAGQRPVEWEMVQRGGRARGPSASASAPRRPGGRATCAGTLSPEIAGAGVIVRPRPGARGRRESTCCLLGPLPAASFCRARSAPAL